MAIFSSANVLLVVALANLNIAYLLLTSPITILNNSFVAVLGPSMRIPPPSFSVTSSSLSHPAASPFAAPSAGLALAALFLAFTALGDLSAILGLPEDAYFIYWSTQMPFRLALLLPLVAWIYLTKPGVGLGGYLEPEGFGAELKNSVVFTWGFMMVMMCFWAFNLVREERTAAAKKEAERRGRTSGMM